MAEYITHSRAETVALGKRMAAVLQPGALIAFTGGLGAGKTAFTEGLAEGLGCTDPVSSPTFAIVNYYRGPRPFAHFDLYRIHRGRPGRRRILRLPRHGGRCRLRVERELRGAAGFGKSPSHPH